MKQIIKNMVPYTKLVILIFVLLLGQAYCDLALPQYTSDIIDTGIQDGGTEHLIPQKITADAYQEVMIFMTEEEKSEWEAMFEKDGSVYTRKEMSDKELSMKDETFLLPILIDYQLNHSNADSAQSEQMAAMRQMIAAGMSLPAEALSAIKSQFETMADAMGEQTLTSRGIAWANETEKAAGVDMDKKQMDYLWFSGAKMLALALFMAVLAVLTSFLAARVGAGIGRDLRHKVFHKVVGFSNSEINRFSTASLITRCTNDVQQIQMVSTLMLRMVLYAPILGLGGVYKVVQNGAGMGWIIVLAVGIISALVFSLMAITMPKFKMMQKLIDRVNLVSREILTGLSVIRAFGREKREEERFDEANTDLMKTQLFTNRVMTFMMPGMMTIMYGINLLIVWVAAHKIDEGMLQVGAMTAFITYAMQIVMSFLMLTMMSIMLPRAGVAAERIQEVIDTEEEICDPKEAKTISDHKGILEFEHVDFRYPGAKENVISDVTFSAKPGEMTAIIGSTGCGKSTMVNLIPRLYDVTGGSIKIDGVDIRELTLTELRDQIGFVPQKGILFSGTIESNLRFGDKDASDEVIREAAEIAQALDFIEEKEQKFESSISQGGSNVSGGQKQRLAIARAIAKHPKIFVFDDSFSALDMKTDAALRKALSEKVADSTMIVVAQRISTILHADRILVLDEGRIVGMGTHEELLKSCEVYKQIAMSQLSAKELGLSEEV